MDDFTQGMAERARQRREALNKKKMVDTPIRKRGVDPDDEESKGGSSQTVTPKDDSPNKRPCLQDLDNQMNSQMIASNETRSSAAVKNDSSIKTNFDAENMVIEVPSSQKSYFSTESESKPAFSDSGKQRGRFAALAERYNTWEDDLSHHDFRKEEKKPSKADKYRYPQTEGTMNVPEVNKNVPEPSTNVPVPSRNVSETNTSVREMTKSAPEAFVNIPKESRAARRVLSTDISVVSNLSENSSRGKFEAVEKEPVEPLTVPLVAETRVVMEERVFAQMSPSRQAEEEILVPLPPTITIPSSTAAQAKTKELGKDEKMGHVSSLTFMIGSQGKGSVSENKGTVSVSSSVSASRTASVPCAVSTPSTMPLSGAASVPNVVRKTPHLKNNDLNASISDEPTRKPVSARLAAWQTKVTANEEKPSVNTRVQILERKYGDREPKRSPHSKSNTPTGSSPKPIQGSPAKSPSIKAGSLQKRSSSRKSKGGLTISSLTKTTPPAKVQPATQSMHDRLSKFCEARTSELVEKSRAGRAAELAMLENRWKNGVLVESDRSALNSEANSFKSSALGSSAIAPVAPPLLPDASAGASSPCTPNRRRSRSADSPASAQSVKSAKKEEARNRIREDFESKLRMMGFDVNSSGSTAAVQLDAIVEQDVDKSKSVKMPAKQSQDTPGKSLNGKPHDVADGKKLECAKVPNSTTTTGAGSSIYNLIRKQIGGTNTAVPASTPVTLAPVVPTSVPSNVLTRSQSRKDEKQRIRRRSTEDEPVESEMDSFDELTEFRKPASVAAKVMRPTAVTFATSVQEITMSEQSESVDSTSQSSEAESYATDDGAAHEDDDSEMDEDGVRHEDETDSEEDEDEQGDGAMSDLLDDAMMDSLEQEEKEKERAVPVAQPAPAPRRQEPSSSGNTQVVMRHPNGRHEAAQENDDKPRGYISLQQYRQEMARPKSQPPGPSHVQRDAAALKRATVMTDHVHGVAPLNGDGAYYGQRRDLAATGSTSQSRNSPAKRTRGLYPDLTVELSHGTEGRHRDEDRMPYIPEKSAKQRIQELQDLVRQELNVIEQTSNALNQCCHGGSAFAGSAEAVECHRLLLMACKKREAYMVEMQRLRERPSMLNSEGPKGRLTISDIRLPLKADFATKIATVYDTSAHYFLVMIRHGSHIVFTQMVSSQEAAARGSVDFPNLINLQNINQRFLVDLEVYAMSVTRDNDTTPKKKKGMTPKKLLTPRSSRTLQSPGGPYAVRSTNFTNVASLQLTMSQLNKTHFSLERVPFSSPLQGSVHLKLKCLIESHIEEKGFLTMFEDVSGFGAWHRRWFLLRGGRLSYWKYPDEEKDNREPMGVIDLKSCVSDRIDLVSREACARPNTFEVTVIRKQQRGERDTLVTKCYDTLSTTKQWISADTKEERLTWCAKLNETLVNIRAWHSDALRPIKPRNPNP